MTWKIIAIGNVNKKDDGIAYKLIPFLKEFNVLDGSISPEALVNVGDKAIFIDAAFFGEKIGTVKTFNVKELSNLGNSTHSCMEIIPLITKESKIIAVQAKDTDFGEQMSSELEENIEKIAENVKKEIEKIIQ